MLIKNYNQMDGIVSNSKKLEWDGWDVICYVKDDSGFFDLDGVFKEGKWYIKKIYKLEQDGWNIPDRIIKNATK